MKGGAKRNPARTSGIPFATVKRWALKYPKVTEGTVYGLPALLAFGKFFVRCRFEAEGGVVVRVASMMERDQMLAHDPKSFFITDHYRNYPIVLVNLDHARPDVIKVLLDASWRRMAPKKLIAEL